MSKLCEMKGEFKIKYIATENQFNIDLDNTLSVKLSVNQALNIADYICNSLGYRVSIGRISDTALAAIAVEKSG